MQVEVIRAPETLSSRPELAIAIDTLGKQSAVAQTLSREITSAKLFETRQAAKQQQILFLAINDGKVLGYLKTGVKHLFYMSPTGEYSELDPICVLDFYVDEIWQRHGIGLQLFQYFLQKERVSPAQLAYDRPSPLLFAFLNKHAGLTNYVLQPNRFVIFNEYFQFRQ
ncbi:alpha-tubulin n-acetyltransferase [Plasmopara halstedii]|uniref:Alpha-tubulin N-acetyltransferase n=1 Tax=Plasmopara halstedii TaxID=4781 RepID=A0A0N7L5M0_PLAHL|nr:alpha-tubulin n-acetyltransferase [Plasmopara halstedii]CEG41851.1 alpha-tubulin n-acetyltransferase [Plasmopara halstedii]|eukprot:XP_024578220.1 alpha-tubulin n-acetyltransferase [Plasmopara halstedii]